MGIKGLLKLLKPIVRNEKLSNFKGKRVAVDGMSLIYRGCYSCASELNQGIETVQYLKFIDKMIALLKRSELSKIIFVIDGMGINLKLQTEKNRCESKEKYKCKGNRLLTLGKNDEAWKMFSRPPTVIRLVIERVISYLYELGGV